MFSSGAQETTCKRKTGTVDVGKKGTIRWKPIIITGAMIKDV